LKTVPPNPPLENFRKKLFLWPGTTGLANLTPTPGKAKPKAWPSKSFPGGPGGRLSKSAPWKVLPFRTDASLNPYVMIEH
jgi:hypothetical protein